MKIQLYGQPNWNNEFIKMNLLEKAKNSGVELQIEEISNWSAILKECVEAIPTVKIDKEEFLSKSSSESINQYTKKVFGAILDKENYGDVPVIIVPVDFSKASEDAFIYAVLLAEKINAVVKIMHVYYPKVGTGNGCLTNGKPLESERREELTQFLKRNTGYWLKESINAPLIDDEFFVGLPVRSIIEYSTRFENSIIVMGTTGEGNAFKKRFGSISTEVAAKAKCPVLLVPPGVNNYTLSHICYALDDVKTDVDAAKVLAPIAKKFNSVISLTHVSKEENDYKWYDLVQYWKLIYSKTKLAVYRYNETDINKGLQEFCTKNNVDLLVMTARNHGFFHSLFNKSSTQESALYTKIPLLILHK